MPRGTIVALAAILSGSVAAHSQDLHVEVSYRNGEAHLRSESATPLALAFYWLAVHYGWPITYEDAALVYSGDMRDATDPEYRRTHPSAVALLPRGGLLAVNFPSPPAIASADPRQATQAIVREYNASGLPGRFKIIRSDTMFHVVPEAVANRDGKILATKPLLDTPVTIRPAVRSLRELLEVMTKAVSMSSSQTIDLGTLPWNLLNQKMVENGFEHVPAREVLRSVVKSMGRNAVWNLLFNANDRTFYLNIVFIGELER